ncbi:MAG TPA: M48 family metallopeptidase [Thermoanaerobaculia bacterium]
MSPTPKPALGAALASSGYTLSPEKYAKAVAFARARYRLHFAGFFWSVLVLVLLLRLRVAVRFRDRAEAFSKRRFLQASVFLPLFLLTQSLLELPPAILRHRVWLLYEQSVQGWGSWLWDRAKELLVATAVGIPIVWLLYAILRRSPRRWWLLFWLALFPILVFLIFLAPVAFDPLFFRFERLGPRHPELADSIERLTASVGVRIPPDRMFEMNASAKYRALNAFVTGLGASKRVVVWDTTIERMTVPETLFVFAHELGHYVLRHIPRTIVFLWALLFVLLAIAAAVLTRILGRDASRGWGIRSLSDWASFPLLLLVLAVGSELALPVVNAYSRGQEHEADVFALEAIHRIVPDSQRVAAQAFQVLGEVSLDDPAPSPFIRFWLYSHPPLAERLRFAAEHDPWGRGEPPRFGHRFAVGRFATAPLGVACC